jgi:hypothetical protein
MSAKVIQGWFLGTQPKLTALVQPKMMAPLPIQTKMATRPPGPPAPAFAGRLAPPIQTKTAMRPPGPPAPAFGGRAATVQRHGAGGPFQVDPGRLGLVNSSGKPLPDAVRGKMEAALRADFSNVRVHTGPQADRIGAIAFTVGSDIYFAPGRYQPETLQGQQLLGHELAHVVQQRAGRVRNPLGSGLAVVQDYALEAEADRMGQRAAAHRQQVVASERRATTIVSPAPALRDQSGAVQPFPWLAAGALAVGVTAGAYYLYSSYFGRPEPQPVPLDPPGRVPPFLGNLARARRIRDLTYGLGRGNRQPQDFQREMAEHMAGRQDTQNYPLSATIFQEDFTLATADRFRALVRSGVEFIWTVSATGVLGIASRSKSQHPIASKGLRVVAAGDGRLKRAAEHPELLEADAAALQRAEAASAREKARLKKLAMDQGQPDPYPNARLVDLIENAKYKEDEAAKYSQQQGLEKVWRGLQDDVVYLNLHSGHYQPELSGGSPRQLPGISSDAPNKEVYLSRAWPHAFEAWRAAGFSPQKSPGDLWV